MISWFTTAAELLVLVVLAFGASWVARNTIARLLRRAALRAQRADGSWRVRLDRLGDDGHADARKRQRVDAVARILGHGVTAAVFGLTTLVALDLVGVDLVLAISSAGFVGFAIALGGQDLVKDVLAGTRVLLEDRCAVGDEVVLRVAGEDVAGTVDLIGMASIRLRTPDGATWHAGHHTIESVTNRSQLPAVSDITVPVECWAEADAAAAATRLAGSSNDVGLTGVVFMRDIETHERDGEPDTLMVRVRANRPLSAEQTDLVRDRLLER